MAKLRNNIRFGILGDQRWTKISGKGMKMAPISIQNRGHQKSENKNKEKASIWTILGNCLPFGSQIKDLIDPFLSNLMVDPFWEILDSEELKQGHLPISGNRLYLTRQAESRHLRIPKKCEHGQESISGKKQG